MVRGSSDDTKKSLKNIYKEEKNPCENAFVCFWLLPI